MKKTPFFISIFACFSLIAISAYFLIVRLPLSSRNMRSANDHERFTPMLNIKNTDEIICSLSFSPDNSMLAAVGGDGWLDIWNPETGENIARLPLQSGTLTSVAFSPNGKELAVSGFDNGDIIFVDCKTWKETRRISNKKGQCVSFAFSPDGSYLAYAAHFQDAAVYMWNMTSWSLEWMAVGHQTGVEALAFSPDGMLVACGRFQGIVEVRNRADGSLLCFADLKQIYDQVSVDSVVFSPDGQSLLSGGVGDNVGKIILWDNNLCKRLGTLDGHSYKISSLIFSPDGQILVSAGSGLGTSDPGEIMLWKLPLNRPLKIIREHESAAVMSASISPNGKRLATADTNGFIKIWDFSALTKNNDSSE